MEKMREKQVLPWPKLRLVAFRAVSVDLSLVRVGFSIRANVKVKVYCWSQIGQD